MCLAWVTKFTEVRAARGEALATQAAEQARTASAELALLRSAAPLRHQAPQPTPF